MSNILLIILQAQGEMTLVDALAGLALVAIPLLVKMVKDKRRREKYRRR